MADKPNYRVNRGDIKISERVALAAVGQSILRSQKVHGTDTSLMFAERAAGYHTSPHKHDCEQMNYIVSGEIYFFVDGRGYRCKVGDVMRIPRNKVHWAWNRGTERAVVFESHSPPLRDRGGGTPWRCSVQMMMRIKSSTCPTYWSKWIRLKLTISRRAPSPKRKAAKRLSSPRPHVCLITDRTDEKRRGLWRNRLR